MSSSTSSFKRFLFASLVTLLALLVIVLGAVELYLRSQTVQSAAEDVYRQRVLHGTAPWAAIGDSHAANGLVTTEWLDNLGQASDNLDSMLGKLALRVNRPGLQGVILSADAQLFSFYRLTADQGGRVRDLLDDRPSLLQFLRSQNRQYLSSTAFAIASDPAVLWRSPVNNLSVADAPVPNTPKWDKDAVLRAQLHTPVRNAKTTPAAREYRRVVKELKQRDIKVCLVTYPLSSAYRRAAASAATFLEVRGFYEEVAVEMGAHLVDASTIFPDNLFGDPDHLSPLGAAQLTAKLQRECDGGGK